MKIGLIGMPLSGKTTFFSLMTNIGLSGDQPERPLQVRASRGCLIKDRFPVGYLQAEKDHICNYRGYRHQGFRVWGGRFRGGFSQSVPGFRARGRRAGSRGKSLPERKHISC